MLLYNISNIIYRTVYRLLYNYSYSINYKPTFSSIFVMGIAGQKNHKNVGRFSELLHSIEELPKNLPDHHSETQRFISL